jgi:2-oxoglutaroyl-CoA hydrolase
MLRIAVDEGTGTATITVDDTEHMNRIPIPARWQLRRIVEDLDREPAVRTVVVRGAGGTAFTAGGDIGGFLKRTPEELSYLHDDIAAVQRCSKPIIAAVDGYCLGVGFEIALASDFILATRQSTFGLPEVTLGMIPGSGGSQRLLRILGPIRAKWIVLRGERLPAERALEWGLVSRVVNNDELDRAIAELVQELNRLSPVALRVAKRVMNAGQDAPLSAGLALDGFAYGVLRSTEDFVEGARAFTDKRSPDFKGR